MSVSTTLPTTEAVDKPDVPTGKRICRSNLSDIYERGTLVLIGCGAAKRDPSDEGDLHVASVGPDESFGPDWTDETGPAWKARDLYTSPYFRLKKQFAERIAGVEDGRDGASPWAILSAEHHVLMPWKNVKYYEKSITELGDDETNPDHRVENPYGLRRPDGREIVTELDQWTRLVAFGLIKWIASFRPVRDPPGTTNAYSLLILAGQDYINPLRDLGVFKYGISHMAGDPNQGPRFPFEPRFLFEEINNDGIGDQMRWLSDAIDRLDEPAAPTEQVTFEGWSP
ncbi:DUF6884 domain-containing protein [Halopenitus sp. H-Gu1]|uniref:DUF6884 domain-containing protein n=1 Tax=Halopenitus sp. H-Gu1 TaxID=3242697 RepID=UPI00359E59CA